MHHTSQNSKVHTSLLNVLFLFTLSCCNYTICHLSQYSSISHVLFHTFIQMLHVSEILSRNEISMNYFPRAAPKQKWFPVITLNLLV